MAWRRDDKEVIVQRHWIEARHGALDVSGATANLLFVQNPLAPEMLAELRVIGDVVPMRQEHRLHSAELFETPHQRPSERGESTSTLPSSRTMR